ncbi:MAG: hypothetical protein RR795_01105 [Cetobacterium sp.]|uniref:hypothetical protein n=1 Tax=Cetobacterium sp. TaxID=2071632 RepID=UPI002FC764C0
MIDNLEKAIVICSKTIKLVKEESNILNCLVNFEELLNILLIMKNLNSKNRSAGIKYRKCEIKKNLNLIKLEKLIYSNFKLSNKELAEKLNISEKEFYRSKFNVVSKELKTRYKKQSLF